MRFAVPAVPPSIGEPAAGTDRPQGLRKPWWVRVVRAVAVPVVLLALTIVWWQGRFEAVAHPLNSDLGFAAGLHGWQLSGDLNAAGRTENGSFVVRFGQPPATGALWGASRVIQPPADVRWLLVAAEARWQDVVPGPWSTFKLGFEPRPALPPHGVWHHGIFLALGSRDWHREEAVCHLPEGVRDIQVSFQTAGQAGTMEVRDLRLAVVRLRPWVNWGGLALALAWVIWMAQELRKDPAAPTMSRSLAAGIVLVLGAWLVVLPPNKAKARPLLGHFATGPVLLESPTTPSSSATPAPAVPAPSSPATAPTANQAPSPPRLRVVPVAGSSATTMPPKPPTSAATTGAVPAPTPATASSGPNQVTTSSQAAKSRSPGASAPVSVTPAPPPAQPSRSPTLWAWFRDALRHLELKLDLVHVGAFLVISGAALLACGCRAPLRFLVPMAALSEAVPDWHDGWFDAADLLDLVANLAGIGVAVWVVGLLVTNRRFGRLRCGGWFRGWRLPGG